MKTSTYFSLLAEFETAQIPLGDMCNKYLDLCENEEKRKAEKQQLPFPVFKIREGQKSKYFVKAEELASHIDDLTERAKKEWQSVNRPSENNIKKLYS